jgi:hypothetical protein
LFEFKSSSSPTLESSSLIAATILDLLLVSRFEISPFFLPAIFLLYSAPRTSVLLSVCKSTSLIASTTEFLISVVNSGVELSPDLLLERFPISFCNSLIASIIVTSSLLTAAKRSLFLIISLRSGLL